MADSDYKSQSIHLVTLSYYPKVGHSKRRTARKVPDQYKFEIACEFLDLSGKEDIPTRYAKAVSGSDVLMWKAVIEFEIDFLYKLAT